MPTFPVITGSVDHANEETIRRPIDMSELITRAEPDNTPLLLLMQTLDFVPCAQEKTEWQERGDEQLFVTVSGAHATTTDTTVDVATGHGKRVVAGDMLYNTTTGEHMLVESVSSDTITVKRDIENGDDDGSAIADAEKLQIMASAMEEGSSARDVTSVQPISRYNYVQTSREGWKASGRIQAVRHYGEDPLTFVRQDKERSFYRKLERKYLMGTRNKLTTTAGPTTFSGGMKFFMDDETGCTQSDQSGVSSWTRSDFNAMLKDAFAIGSGYKMAICGWDVLNILGDFVWEKLQVVDQMRDTIRVMVRRYECDYGTLDIMPHKLFTADPAYGGLGITGEMWVFDPENIKRSGLPGRSDISLFTGPSGDQLQGSSEDATHQELWVEDCIQYRHPETGYRAYGSSA